jgi:uncharacterized membrane protein YciS (DUF1049 family)
MITKRLLNLYAYSVQVNLFYTIYLASPFDWNGRKKKVTRTSGITNFLYFVIFFVIGIVMIGVSLRTISRFYFNSVLDPMSTAVTVIYLTGLATVWVIIFEILIRNARDDLIQFANQTIQLDKQLQRKDCHIHKRYRYQFHDLNLFF